MWASNRALDSDTKQVFLPTDSQAQGLPRIADTFVVSYMKYRTEDTTDIHKEIKESGALHPVLLNNSLSIFFSYMGHHISF